jgi:PhnB protein
MGSVASDSNVFRAVADSTRRAILDLLRQSECTVGELARPFRMTRPAVSQHLRILRSVGLVRARRAGRAQVYRLNPSPLRSLNRWMARYGQFADPSGHVWNLQPWNDRQRRGGRRTARVQTLTMKGAAMAIHGARPNNHQVAPHLIVRDVAQAIDFYQRALGAQVLYRGQIPNGMVVHAHLRIAESVIMVSLENMGADEQAMAKAETGMRVRAPETLRGTTTILELYVPDVDAAFKRAIDAGGTTKLEVKDQFYGDRYGMFTDPFGHIWALASVKETLTAQEIEARVMGHFASAPRG